MTDGVLWHKAASAKPYLQISSGKTASIAEGQPPDSIDPDARQIVGGGQIIVRDDHPVAHTNRFATARHPRMAVGIGKTGTEITLSIVDGRQPWLSIGMTVAQLSDEMVRLGCFSAINLDGGGSTTLVYHDPQTDRLEVFNSPLDTKERSVADVFGVRIAAPLPEVK